MMHAVFDFVFQDELEDWQIISKNFTSDLASVPYCVELVSFENVGTNDMEKYFVVFCVQFSETKWSFVASYLMVSDSFRYVCASSMLHIDEYNRIKLFTRVLNMIFLKLAKKNNVVSLVDKHLDGIGVRRAGLVSVKKYKMGVVWVRFVCGLVQTNHYDFVLGGSLYLGGVALEARFLSKLLSSLSCQNEIRMEPEEDIKPFVSSVESEEKDLKSDSNILFMQVDNPNLCDLLGTIQKTLGSAGDDGAVFFVFNAFVAKKNGIQLWGNANNVESFLVYLFGSRFKNVKVYSIIEGLSCVDSVVEGFSGDASDWIVVCSQPKVFMQDVDVSIIIPVRNKFEYTIKALHSILNNTSNVINYEILIIDNASSDKTELLVKKLFPRVIYHKNDSNFGFARATNQGAVLASGKYLVFLNNDTEVKQGWLDPLLDELQQDDKVGVVGSRLLYPDGRIQHAGVVIDRSMTPVHVHRFRDGNDPLVTERREFSIVTAACMAVRKNNFLEIGMFDECFINGHEDIDLCLRFKKIGMKVVYRPESLVVHHESVSSGRLDHCDDNKRRTRSKWYESLIQDDFHYNILESSREQSQSVLRFAIKIAPPDRTQLNWGDTYFAESLAQKLDTLGHFVRIDYLDEWGRRDLDIDVVIHIKGLSEYYPKAYNLNIAWVINHPDSHSKKDLSRYDVILVSSDLYAQHLKNELDIPVYVFHQATDCEHFVRNADNKEFDLVFVGNNKGTGRLSMRKIVSDVLPTSRTFAVWGKGWEGLLPDGVWQGEFVEWDDLPRIYSMSKIVLNDHQSDMKEHGFINNRNFDAIAAGSLVVSDYVSSMETVFPVPYYNDKEEFGLA